MIFNILNGKVGDAAKQPVKITEKDFWIHYLMFLNIRWQYYMSEKEIQVFSTVLSLEQGVSYFTKPAKKILQSKVAHLSDSEITRVKKKLLELGVVEESPHPKDKRTNITLPVASLRKLQTYIKSKKEITFTFPYEITEESE